LRGDSIAGCRGERGGRPSGRIGGEGDGVVCTGCGIVSIGVIGVIGVIGMEGGVFVTKCICDLNESFAKLILSSKLCSLQQH